MPDSGAVGIDIDAQPVIEQMLGLQRANLQDEIATMLEARRVKSAYLSRVIAALGPPIPHGSPRNHRDLTAGRSAHHRLAGRSA